MQEITYHAKFLAKNTDMMGYSSYVFENLDSTDCSDKYIMCVRFPNWNQAPFMIGDVGFLSVNYVEEGKDEWFNGQDFVKYRYTSIIFMKFILEKSNNTKEYILD